MKKYSLVIALIVMISAMGCGKGNAEVDSVNGSNEMNVESDVSTENVGSDNKEDESTLIVPEVEYEEWLMDDEDNKLFGFNIPEGWAITERRTKRNFTLKDSSVNEIKILYVASDTGTIPTLFEQGRCKEYEHYFSYYNDGEMDTEAYGKIKFIYEDGIEENLAGTEYAILKVCENGYVCVNTTVWSTENFDAHYEYQTMLEELVKEMFVLDGIFIGTPSTDDQIEVPTYDYPYWIEDDEGNDIMGFNAPEGMNREEVTMLINGVEETQDGIWFKGDSCSFSISLATSERAECIEKGVYAKNNYTLKNTIETVYGTAKIYEMTTTNGIDDKLFYMEYALININGQNVIIEYCDYKVVGYTGKLEEIIKSQLFMQE